MNLKKDQGQALIPVLIILLIIITLGVGILFLNLGGMLTGLAAREGEAVLLAAEGAMENGLLRLLRSPAWEGESLQIGGQDCTITVSGTAPKIMAVSCWSAQARRNLRAEISFIAGEMNVDLIEETE